MPAYTFSFPAAAADLPVSITDATGGEVATDTLGPAVEVQGPIILTASLPTGSYVAAAVDPAIYVSFRAPGVIDPSSVLNVAASTYGVVARYANGAPSAGGLYAPAWDYLDEIGDFLTVDAEDPDDNRLVINAPGVYQIAVSAETPFAVSAPGEFLVRMSFAGTGDPGYAQPVARVVYDDTRGQGAISRVLVVPPGSTASFSAYVSAITDCEIDLVEVQVTKIA